MTAVVQMHESVRADIQRLHRALGDEAAVHALREVRETVTAFLAQSRPSAGTFVVETPPAVRAYFVLRQHTDAAGHAHCSATIVQLESLTPLSE